MWATSWTPEKKARGAGWGRGVKATEKKYKGYREKFGFECAGAWNAGKKSVTEKNENS